jgi:hypothetical protein
VLEGKAHSRRSLQEALQCAGESLDSLAPATGLNVPDQVPAVAASRMGVAHLCVIRPNVLHSSTYVLLPGTDPLPPCCFLLLLLCVTRVVTPAAPTVILQQVNDTELCTSVPESAAASVLVWPQRGSYCLFDGRLAHGVLDSCSSSLRATLLVNWWAQRPQVCC